MTYRFQDGASGFEDAAGELDFTSFETVLSEFYKTLVVCANGLDGEVRGRACFSKVVFAKPKSTTCHLQLNFTVTLFGTSREQTKIPSIFDESV